MITDVSLGMRDTSVPETHWRDMTDFQFPKTGKVVLIFPGGTVRKTKLANGCIKRFNATMGDLLSADTQVFCAYYNDDGVPNHRLRALKKARVLNDVKSSFPDEELPPAPNFRQFFNYFFLPILLDENKKVRSVNEICSCLNRMVTVSYCYGGFVAYEMARMLEAQLKYLKFSLQDRNKICKAFKVVACASRFPMQASKSTVMHLVSYSDKQQERNWNYKNFHAFLNTRKRRRDAGALILLRQNEVVLSAEKLLLNEMDDHHYRGYFLDDSMTYEKTDEWADVSKIMCSYIQAQLNAGGKKSVLQILKSLPDRTLVSKRLNEGKKCLLDFKAYLLKIKKLFMVQESYVKNNQVDLFKDFLRKGIGILPLKNKSGDFLVHTAIEQNNLEMLNLIIKNEPNWFQSFNAKGETPVLIALKKRNVDMAYFLWKNLSQVQLPVFESYHILRNIQRKVFRGVLLYVRRIPEAAQLLEKMLDDGNFLPIKSEDAFLIARHFANLKNKRSKSALFVQSVLSKCLDRAVEENGFGIIEAMPIDVKKHIPMRVLKSLTRED